MYLCVVAYGIQREYVGKKKEWKLRINILTIEL